MTRINVIEPNDLSDEDLIIEYSQLPDIFAHVEKHGIDQNRIPKKYTLGKDHVLFFTNKLRYLRARFWEIKKRLVSRGYNIDEKLFQEIDNCMKKLIDKERLKLDSYCATAEDKYLNMAHIVRLQYENAKKELLT